MTHLETYVKVPRLTPGRRRLALQRMLSIVQANLDWAFLEPAIDVALTAQEDTIRTLVAWRDAQESAAMHASEATQLDVQVDQALSAWLGILRSTQSGFGETSPEALAAAFMEETLFSNGVGPITSLPYVDQHGEVDLLLTRVQEDEPLAEAATTLNLEPLLTRLTELNAAYGAALSRTATLSYAELQALDREAWRSVVGVFVRIMGAFPDPTDEHDDAVRTLVEPYAVQAAEFAKLKQRRSSGSLFDFDATDAVEEGDEAEGLDEDADEPEDEAAA